MGGVLVSGAACPRNSVAITETQCLHLDTQLYPSAKVGFILRLHTVAKREQKLRLTCFQLQVL